MSALTTTPVMKQGSSVPPSEPGVDGPVDSAAVQEGTGGGEGVAQVQLREVMVGQGVLEGLVRCMGRAELLSEGLEVLEALHLLLRRHVLAQAQFAGLDGYAAIGQMLERLLERGVRPGDDVDAFLREALLLWMGLIADGPLCVGARVRSTAALRGLVSLVRSCGDLEVGLQAVQCLTDLLTLHPLNIVALEHVHTIEVLMQVLASALLPFYPPQETHAYMSAARAALGMGPSPTSSGVTEGGKPTAPQCKGPEAAALPTGLGGALSAAEGGMEDAQR